MGEPQAACRDITFQGQPGRCLALPGGDTLTVLLHGAHVVSWVAGGRERLYLSPRSVFDGQAAIRGGVPICFPQFNQRGPLPKHGFARNHAWQAGVPVLDDTTARLDLSLGDNAATRALWPQAFEARLGIELVSGRLRLTLAVHNRDAVPLAFTGALHTYLALDDIRQATLHGLGGQPEWDTVTDRPGVCAEPLRIDGEHDRICDATAGPLTLRDGDRALQLAQSAHWAHTVVWNPGAERGATINDLPGDGFRHMLCVEAAQVLAPVTLAPGAHWQGWQQLSLA